jgi:hypothetical protein
VAKNKGKYNAQAPDAAPALEPSEAALNTWEKAQGSIAPHRNKILALVATVIVVLLAVGIHGWWSRRRETAATLDFQKAIETAQARVTGNEQVPNLDLPGADPDAPTFKTTDEKNLATLTALDKIEKEHSGAKVAKHAKMTRAALLFDMGRFDQAAASYREVVSLGGPLATIAREGVGLSLEAKALAEKDGAARTAGLDAALAEFKLLQPDDKGFYRDMALYHQGRILQLKEDKAGAIAVFKELTTKFASSAQAREARARLELLEE